MILGILHSLGSLSPLKMCLMHLNSFGKCFDYSKDMVPEIGVIKISM